MEPLGRWQTHEHCGGPAPSSPRNLTIASRRHDGSAGRSPVHASSARGMLPAPDAVLPCSGRDSPGPNRLQPRHIVIMDNRGRHSPGWCARPSAPPVPHGCPCRNAPPTAPRSGGCSRHSKADCATPAKRARDALCTTPPPKSSTASRPPNAPTLSATAVTRALNLIPLPETPIRARPASPGWASPRMTATPRRARATPPAPAVGRSPTTWSPIGWRVHGRASARTRPSTRNCQEARPWCDRGAVARMLRGHHWRRSGPPRVDTDQAQEPCDPSLQDGCEAGRRSWPALG
jgi:hypothetical protein